MHWSYVFLALTHQHDVFNEISLTTHPPQHLTSHLLQLSHYSDVIMGTTASQITSFTFVLSTVYSGTDERKHQSSASLAFVRGNSPVTDEFPAQMASNMENASIWWCHHDPGEVSLVHVIVGHRWHHFDGLVQERRNSSALAMELRLSCTDPLIYT